MKKISQNFPFFVDLWLKEFSNSVNKGDVLQYSFEEIEASVWFERFKNEIISSIGKKYFPVLRISDGEFLFCLGFKPQKFTEITSYKSYLKSLFSAYMLGRRTIWFMSGSKGYGYEKYNFIEWRKLRNIFEISVKGISQNGILAIGFVHQKNPYGEEYHDSMLNWFESKKIELNSNNYYPFYFVYALLNGSSLKQLVENRRILVVSSHEKQAQDRISGSLLSLNANDVCHYSISRTSAMKEKISIKKLPGSVDIILVAAGVGSAQIIPQLSFYETLVIDAGFCVDLLANPELAGRRYFTLSDHGIS